MRTESTVRPPETAVEKCGEIADVILCENIVEEVRDETTIYTYDEYRVAVPYRETLAAAVVAARAAWLEKAISEEMKPPAPTLEEEVSALKTENAALRAKNKELDDLITVMLGGSENG